MASISLRRLRRTERTASAFTLVEIMVVVVIIGLLAAMAIPSFFKIRDNSQDKIATNNLRLLAAAADQYFLENGVSHVASSLLVGTYSSQYIRQIETVAKESYSDVWQGSAVTATGVAETRTVTYTH